LSQFLVFSVINAVITLIFLIQSIALVLAYLKTFRR